MRPKAAAMARQLGMMVHFLPSASAAIEAGMTTIKLTTAIPENVMPACIKQQSSLQVLLEGLACMHQTAVNTECSSQR